VGKIVVVLLLEVLRFRFWVDYEFALASSTALEVFGSIQGIDMIIFLLRGVYSDYKKMSFV
jgi:hypothetical protein